jgi:predicted CxxxxCH...CXXCH cytochrome family protein
MRNFSIVSASIALAALTACATAENVEGVAGGGSGCVSCHGGKDNQSGAPPFDVANNSTTSKPSVGAHTTHITQGVTCGACHVDPRNGAAPQHGTLGHGKAEVVFSGISASPDPANAATYSRSNNTCSNVYCHEPFRSAAGSLPTPTWNVPAGTITGCDACHQGPSVIHGGALGLTQCATCHPTTVDANGAIKPGGTHVNGTVDHFTHDPNWMTTTDATPHTIPHGVAANYGNPAWPGGWNDCRACHGSNLDNPIASTAPSCDKCHTSGTAAWRTNCTFCHGNFGGSALPTDAAPPRDVLGNTDPTSKHVGAHQVHLFGDATNTPRISNGVACTDCHGGTGRTLPASFQDHANGAVEVTPKQPGQTGQTGTYDSATGTCSNVYCHGALTRNAQAGNNPSWTATSGQSTCGTCHAANGVYGATDAMTGLHAKHRCGSCHGTSSTGNSKFFGCFACHVATYQQQLGTLPPKVNLSTHVDGMVEVVGSTSVGTSAFDVALNYTAPTSTTPASCTTACHTNRPGHISAGAPSSGSANWQ